MSTDFERADGEGRRVRIYVSEEDCVGRMPARHAILDFLRRNNASGVTVLRALEGFGASGRIHSSRLAEVPWDLPLVIEWIDTVERVQQLLPKVLSMVPPGMVTVEPTTVALAALRQVRPMSDGVCVDSVMTRDVVTVRRNTPIRDVIARMRDRSVRAVPVIDQGRVVGMITHSDVVARGELGVRITLLPGLDPAEQQRRIDSLPERVAEQIMTAPPVTISSNASLGEAAETMVLRRLKRLPVVDGRGEIVGIVSRLDLLRTVADFGQRKHERDRAEGLQGDGPLSAVMRQDVPTVYPDAPLHDVVQAVVSTRLNRALVVDAERRVLGLVSDKAVLERVTPALQPSLLRSLMHRLPFVRSSEEEREVERHAVARTAADLMTTEVLQAGPDDPVYGVVAAMIEGGQKLVAIVDDEGRLMGVVDRADVLRGILDPDG